MAITSGFFDSINGDRTYNAEQMSNYFDGLVSNGIYESIGDRFVVQAGSGMNVTVGTGRALIQSRWIKNDAIVTLTLDAADLQLNRIDAIVLQLDLTESGREINIVIKKGTPATNPTKPNIIQSSDIYELCLAYVNIGKNTASIVQNNITDMRASSLCGWVTGLITQVNTADLFLQWQTAYENYYAQSTAAFDAYIQLKQAAFDDWFSTLTKELKVDTTLVKYQNTVTVSGETMQIAIGIAEYDSNTDVLFTYVNGVFLVEGNEYTIIGTGDSANIILTRALNGENNITFVVLKNAIGGSVYNETQSDTITDEVTEVTQ